MELTEEQKKALSIMNKGYNVFLTGKAGTGKSTIINEFVQNVRRKNVLIFAPTGIAAIRVGGSTLHRGFGFEMGVLSPTKYPFVPAIIESADTIIIDEISMCRVDMFDRIVQIIEKANKTRARYQQEPIQIILVGDFFQLPPVATEPEKEALRHIYPKLTEYYAFNSEYWDQLSLHYVMLKDVMRQDNQNFVQALNDIRIGRKEAVSYINKNSTSQKIEDAVVLTGINRVASEINQEELDKIPSSPETFSVKIKGQVSKSDLCVDEMLTLKEGARVMTIVNGDGYQNGSLGWVEYINRKSKVICVRLDDGDTVLIKKHTWEVYGYRAMLNADGTKTVLRETIGTYKQYPLKLAYAITIHKSQGQTFDKMNLIPYCWDHGQLYVALSRVSSLSGLHLVEPIKERYLKTSKGVLNFYEKCSKLSQKQE